MTRISKGAWAFSLAFDCAERSTCSRRKAGSVGLDKYGRVVGIGYNGVPRGFVHCTETACPGALDKPGDTSRCQAVHAEVNMVLNSSTPYNIEEVYLTVTPCFACALILANLPNLKTVYAPEYYADERGVTVLKEAGVTVTVSTEAGWKW